MVRVKGGKDRQRNHIDQLKAVVDRERAQIGVFLTFEEPTKPMVAEAAGAGQYAAEGFENPVPKIQIVTIEGRCGSATARCRCRSAAATSSGKPRARRRGGRSICEGVGLTRCAPPPRPSPTGARAARV